MGEKIPNFVAFRGKDWQLLAAKYFKQGATDYTLYHECPLWCSIVGAKVTVHQFFCILHLCDCLML